MQSSAAAKQQIPAASDDRRQGERGLAASSRFWNPHAAPNTAPSATRPNRAARQRLRASVAPGSAAAGRRHVQPPGDVGVARHTGEPAGATALDALALCTCLINAAVWPAAAPAIISSSACCFVVCLQSIHPGWPAAREQPEHVSGFVRASRVQCWLHVSARFGSSNAIGVLLPEEEHGAVAP